MNLQCTAVVATSPEQVIGADGKLPWHYPEDLKRFKSLTIKGTVIMGRITFESIGKKPLPDRRNIVITRANFNGVECYPTLESALAKCGDDEKIFIIGGAQIYRAALRYCNKIDFTQVPNQIPATANTVRFPELSEEEWQRGPVRLNKNDSRLQHCTYTRRR